MMRCPVLPGAAPCCPALQVNTATFVRVDYAGELEEAVNRQIE